MPCMYLGPFRHAGNSAGGLSKQDTEAETERDDVL
jgi:hypothetical protein